MDRRRKGESGLSLVELLVVLGIIAIISGVAIPILARGGLFTSNKAALAARELFTVLRAAKIYATTHNVETALAYTGTLSDPNAPPSPAKIVDSFFEGDPIPVVDSVSMVRRLTRKEMLILITQGLLPNFSPTDEVYVQVSTREGGFKKLPNGTCILSDIFEAEDRFNNGTFVSSKGLTDVRIFDIANQAFLTPREDYALGGAADDFPAHKFSPEGQLITKDSFSRQRIRFHVGLLPNAEPSDRFFLNIDEIRPENETAIPIVFSNQDLTQPETVRINLDPARGPGEFATIDIDIDIFLYVATGRVKVGT